MTILKGRRDPESIEPILLYASLSEPDGEEVGLHDDDRLEDFLARIKDSIQSSLSIGSRMHGFRTQALFKAVMVGLGGFQMLKDEDVGEIYFEESLGEIGPPDFRVVDSAGETILIEVKNVPPHRTTAPLILRSADFLKVVRYGKAVGAPVLFAVYWSGGNLWTLVDARHFEHRGNNFELDVRTAVTFNQLPRFGDSLIGIKPPLVLRLFVEQQGPSSDIPDGFEAKVKVVAFELESGGEVVEAEDEAQIALSLFRYGSLGAAEENVVLDEAGEIESIEITVHPSGPEEAIKEQGFALMGAYSSMISSFFNSKTLAEDGNIQELHQAVDPGVWSSLVPDSYWDEPDRQLKIWKLNIVPNDAD